MARLMSAKCPECDARLELEPLRPAIRCPYCGTLSRVEGGRSRRASGAFDAAELADLGDLDDLPVIRLRDPLRWLWAVGGIAVLAVVLLATYFSLSSLGGEEAAPFSRSLRYAGAAPGEPMSWDGELEAMVADANGDGLGDPIGWVRFPHPRAGYDYHLAAFDAARGKRLWLSERLSHARRLAHSRAALVGGLVLHVDSGGLLRAVRVADGRVAWSAVMGAGAYRVGGEADGLARVELMGGGARVVRLADGQVIGDTRRATGEGPCAGAFADRGGQTPWQLHRFSLTGEAARELPSLDGVEVRRAIYDVATGAAVAVGDAAARDRERAHLVGFDPRTPGPRGGLHRLARWAVPIAPEAGAHDPRIELSQRPAAAHGRVFVPYRTRGDWRLTCVDAVRGARLFDRALPFAGGEEIGGVTASARQVFVSAGRSLHVLDVATGDYRLTFGK